MLCASPLEQAHTVHTLSSQPGAATPDLHFLTVDLDLPLPTSLIVINLADVLLAAT